MIGFCAVDLASSDNAHARSFPRSPAHRALLYSTTKLVTNSVRFLTRHQNGMWMEWMGRWVSGSVDRWVGGSMHL